MGVAFFRVSVSTRPIFFFLIIDLRSALKVRLLPEYACREWNVNEELDCKNRSYHLIWVDELGMFDVIFKGKFAKVLKPEEFDGYSLMNTDSTDICWNIHGSNPSVLNDLTSSAV